jgi:hypothetical protein
MGLRIDLSGSKATSYDVLPAGTYVCKVTDYEMKQTANAGKLPAGTPGIRWEFTIQDGEHAGRKVWTNTWLHENTFGFLKSLMAASGRFTDEQLDGEIDFEPEALLGADVRVVVKVKPANDQYEASNDVKGYKRMTDAPAGTATSMLP